MIDKDIIGDNTRVATNYGSLCTTVEVGSKIMIDNGALELEVSDIAEVSSLRPAESIYLIVTGRSHVRSQKQLRAW